MDYYKLTANNEEDARALLNDSIYSGELFYKPFSRERFHSFFVERKDANVHPVCLLSEDSSVFASGCMEESSSRLFITLILTKKGNRRKGFGSDALIRLEAELLALAPSTSQKSLEITFFNPMAFEWEIPNTDRHDHPNAPGVDRSGAGYPFFLSQGYQISAFQNSYYARLPLSPILPKICTKRKSLGEMGFTTAFYDGNRHYGLDALFNDLQNESWRQAIQYNLERQDGGNPVLIMERNGRVMGFAGPLSVQKSGRGFFSGIGIHSDCRGCGVGMVLFDSLCFELYTMGASFMSLFTGENNPARKIYESAGFSIVRSWADLQKTGNASPI